MARFFVILGILWGVFSCQSDSQSVQNKNSQGQDSIKVVPIDSAEYLDKGNQIVKTTFDTLSNALRQTIATKGIEGALKYCNTAALPITNLYTETNDVTVRRTSMKNRNEDNKPDTLEVNVLESYERMKGKNEPLKEQIVVDGMSIHYFKPIIIQALCLNCHGKVGKTLDAKNHSIIAKLYPNDKAIDYQLNELRGAWHITFKKTKK